jgi:hypothetical protein
MFEACRPCVTHAGRCSLLRLPQSAIYASPSLVHFTSHLQAYISHCNTSLLSLSIVRLPILAVHSSLPSCYSHRANIASHFHPECATKSSSATQYVDAYTTSMLSTRVPHTASVDIQYKRRRCLLDMPAVAIAVTDQRSSTTLAYCQILDTKAVHFHHRSEITTPSRHEHNLASRHCQRRSLNRSKCTEYTSTTRTMLF